MIGAAQQQRRDDMTGPVVLPSNSSIYNQNADRTGLITVTTNLSMNASYNDPNTLVNNDTFSNEWQPTAGQSVAGKYVQFYFNGDFAQIGSAHIQGSPQPTTATWKWQSSTDGVGWADRSFNNAGIPQLSKEDCTVFGTVTAPYWRIVGISGTYQSGQLPMTNVDFDYT